MVLARARSLLLSALLAGHADGAALVLSGGGARGAWEVGALEAVCTGNVTGVVAGSWDVYVGTSIGALNAGCLAQYDQADFCEGVKAMRAFWDAIKVPEDIFVSSNGHSKCLSGWNGVDLGEAYWHHGAFCDRAPGTKAYRTAISAERIAASDVRLHVCSSSLGSGKAEWFTDDDPNVLDGVLASGALSPLLYPAQVPDTTGGAWYVDGGLFHNTPILRALELGEREVLALLLDPLDGTNLGIDYAAADNKGNAIVEFYTGVIQDIIFREAELRRACYDYPDAQLLGLAPPADLGSIIAFDAADISSMRETGFANALANGTVDLCKAMGYPRGGGVGVGSVGEARAAAAVREAWREGLAPPPGWTVVGMLCAASAVLASCLTLLCQAGARWWRRARRATATRERPDASGVSAKPLIAA